VCGEGGGPNDVYICKCKNDKNFLKVSGDLCFHFH
jgi:hypothetical protein